MYGADELVEEARAHARKLEEIVQSYMDGLTSEGEFRRALILEAMQGGHALGAKALAQ